MKPKKAFNYNNRGLVFFHIKRYEEALKDFDEAIELDSVEIDTPDPYFFFNRGNTLLAMKEYAKA